MSAMNDAAAAEVLGSCVVAGDTRDNPSGISCEEIQKVQNLIEKCLQLYMTQEEVVNTLSSEAGVQARFTTLVWQKLEEQNPEFFRAYYTRLKLKDQIVLFNHLLEQQVQIIQKLQPSFLQAAHGQQFITAGLQRPMLPISLAMLPPNAFAPRPPGLAVAPPAISMPPGVPTAAACSLFEATPGSQPIALQQAPSLSQPPQSIAQPAVGLQPALGAGPAAASSTMPVAASRQPGHGTGHAREENTAILSVPPASEPADPVGTVDAAAGGSIVNADGGGTITRTFSLSDLNLDLQGNLAAEGEQGLGLLNPLGNDGLDLGLDLDVGVQS